MPASPGNRRSACRSQRTRPSCPSSRAPSAPVPVVPCSSLQFSSVVRRHGAAVDLHLRQALRAVLEPVVRRAARRAPGSTARGRRCAAHPPRRRSGPPGGPSSPCSRPGRGPRSTSRGRGPPSTRRSGCSRSVDGADQPSVDVEVGLSARHVVGQRHMVPLAVGARLRRRGRVAVRGGCKPSGRSGWRWWPGSGDRWGRASLPRSRARPGGRGPSPSPPRGRRSGRRCWRWCRRPRPAPERSGRTSASCRRRSTSAATARVRAHRAKPSAVDRVGVGLPASSASKSVGTKAWNISVWPDAFG